MVEVQGWVGRGGRVQGWVSRVVEVQGWVGVQGGWVGRV